jgi:hypothetical protein
MLAFRRQDSRKRTNSPRQSILKLGLISKRQPSGRHHYLLGCLWIQLFYSLGKIIVLVLLQILRLYYIVIVRVGFHSGQLAWTMFQTTRSCYLSGPDGSKGRNGLPCRDHRGVGKLTSYCWMYVSMRRMWVGEKKKNPQYGRSHVTTVVHPAPPEPWFSSVSHFKILLLEGLECVSRWDHHT